MTTLRTPKSLDSALKKASTLLVVAREGLLKDGFGSKVLPKEVAGRLADLIEDQAAGPMGSIAATIGGAGPRRLAVAMLPDGVSRHASEVRAEELTDLAARASLDDQAVVLIACEDTNHLPGALSAIGRALPLYDRRTGRKAPKAVSFLAFDAKGNAVGIPPIAVEIAQATREAARLVDTTAEELDPAAFVREARALVRGVAGVTTKVIAGKALLDEKLGGLHAVGRAAKVEPRLLLLEYKPAKGKASGGPVAIVGKGIVYDTGGLNLKSGAGMATMKCDMGGAAAVLGAFRVLAATKSKQHVIAAIALAENAMGPHSYRPGDILTMHSGHTVEINNTDAEGRLVLADALSYVLRKKKAKLVIDAATLTGAQMVATGTRHAAVISSREELQAQAVASGKASGELAWPLPFAPAYYQPEFSSQVADMKNSVANRANAQCSCAAQFIWAHIDDLDPAWLHIDLAGPAFRKDRGTGFGVGLISHLVTAL